mgnify:CR=1 FL=1
MSAPRGCVFPERLGHLDKPRVDPRDVPPDEELLDDAPEPQLETPGQTPSDMTVLRPR